jgi:hypothetical protein
MVGVKIEDFAMNLFLAKSKEALDGGMAMRAVLPFAIRPPLEMRYFRGGSQRFARFEQGRHVHAVLNCILGSAHFSLPLYCFFFLWPPVVLWRYPTMRLHPL